MENDAQVLNPISKNTSDNDWFLRTLISFVNITDSKLTFGITLVTHGFLVSGTLIGTEEYFNGIALEFGNSLDNALKNKERFYENTFRSLGEKTKPTETGNIAFIHLKGAKIYNTSGAAIPNNKGIWWRGRLVEISGFSMGLLSEIF